MAELLDALDFAHNAGVIHRDIKPANVMIDGEGHAKLADFGVARIIDPDRQTGGATQAGTMVGTPAYMSPEQVQGLKADGRTDIFSAGVILYQFLTGRKPFSGGAWTMARMILQEDPPPPSSIVPSVSPEYDRVVARALAKNPDKRYQSAHEFAQALQHVLEGRTQLAGAEEAPPASAPAPSEAQGTEVELEFWGAIKDTDDPEELELYLQNFPHGVYTALARRKMAELRGAIEQAEDNTAGPSTKQAIELRARREAEERAKREAEEQARREAEEKARREAEEKARREAEEKAHREAEEKARRIAEEKARHEAEEKARLEAVARLVRESQARAMREAERKAVRADEVARNREARKRAQEEAEEMAVREGREKARREAEARFRLEEQAKARREAEENARREAAAAAGREAEDRARRAAEAKAVRAAREKALRLAEQKMIRAVEAAPLREAREKARLEREEHVKREIEALLRREKELADSANPADPSGSKEEPPASGPLSLDRIRSAIRRNKPPG